MSNQAHVKEPIVVTGASGRTGRRITERRLAAGHKLRVVGRHEGALKSFASRGADLYIGSIKDRGFLTKAFEGAKSAYLMTALDVHVPEVNVDKYEKAEGIAGAVRDAHLEHVIFTSSWGRRAHE